MGTIHYPTQDIEEYKNRLEKILEKTGFKTKVTLRWDHETELTNISAIGAGLDLKERGISSYQEHNLGTKNSLALGA